MTTPVRCSYRFGDSKQCRSSATFSVASTNAPTVNSCDEHIDYFRTEGDVVSYFRTEADATTPVRCSYLNEAFLDDDKQCLCDSTYWFGEMGTSGDYCCDEHLTEMIDDGDMVRHFGKLSFTPRPFEKNNPVREHDEVNNPRHYTSHASGVECIDVVEHMPFNTGNAVKYLWREGKKVDAIQDLKKAIWYINREIERLSTMYEDDGKSEVTS